MSLCIRNTKYVYYIHKNKTQWRLLNSLNTMIDFRTIIMITFECQTCNNRNDIYYYNYFITKNETYYEMLTDSTFLSTQCWRPSQRTLQSHKAHVYFIRTCQYCQLYTTWFYLILTKNIYIMYVFQQNGEYYTIYAKTITETLTSHGKHQLIANSQQKWNLTGADVMRCVTRIAANPEYEILVL